VARRVADGESLHTEDRLYEHPACQAPRPSFFFSFFLSLPPFFCSTAPQAFFRPDRVLSRPARADAVKAGRSSAATPPGAPAFTAIEHDGRLDGSVD
jgi:hypothetical protein